jgi:broad specificity phosphatase PhoE
MRHSLALLALLLFANSNLILAQESFTIYLVRHAEKALSDNREHNPTLTECGLARAQSLAYFFDDIQLDAIYSTDYKRTLLTAKATAIAKKLETELYDPQKLQDFAKELIAQGENALIVGHSNTTGVLASFIAGIEDPSMILTEADYNRIYKIVISEEGGIFYALYSSFECHP